MFSHMGYKPLLSMVSTRIGDTIIMLFMERKPVTFVSSKNDGSEIEK